VPLYSIHAIAFNDANANGLLDSGEPGLAGLAVDLLSGGVVIDTQTTDATGSAVFGETLDPGDYQLRCGTPAGTWTFTTPNPYPLTLTAGVLSYLVKLGMAQNLGRVCFRRGSSWVDRVCWVPGRGVEVQFKDRHGAPYFCCYYPGTTYTDYLLFHAAPSLGRHVRQWYYWRPYVPVPVGS
jgi:hypothetical protein